ncbi:MAG: hypothetical protein ACR2QK_23185 [Acidimicrobiales bacterium]
MPKYVLAYHGGSGMPESEAEQAKIMEAWGAWFGTLGEAVVDGGNPTSRVVTIAADRTNSEGGPNPLTGYSLISAADMDSALKMAEGCPVLDSGGSVEVAETVDM